MNIFVLHENPVLCAKYHNDTHVIKMLTESCQILCTAHHVLKSNLLIPYKPTHVNHPCVKWVLESPMNYVWLSELAIELSKEYTFRFNKNHKAGEVALWCSNNYPKYSKIEMRTKFAIGFNLELYKDCITDNIIESYRNFYKNHKQGYYRGEKWIEYKWTQRERPYFMN